jgi:hypothetical protein
MKLDLIISIKILINFVSKKLVFLNKSKIMKDKFDFLIGNSVYGLITVSIVVLVIIAVAVAYITYF